MNYFSGLWFQNVKGQTEVITIFPNIKRAFSLSSKLSKRTYEHIIKPINQQLMTFYPAKKKKRNYYISRKKEIDTKTFFFFKAKKFHLRRNKENRKHNIIWNKHLSTWKWSLFVGKYLIQFSIFLFSSSAKVDLTSQVEVLRAPWNIYDNTGFVNAGVDKIKGQMFVAMYSWTYSL